MARTIHRLSPSKVRTAKAGMWCDGGGLYLQCTASANGTLRKSLNISLCLQRRERQMGLAVLKVLLSCRSSLQSQLGRTAWRHAR